MKTLIRGRVLRRLNWVCTVRLCPKNGTLITFLIVWYFVGSHTQGGGGWRGCYSDFCQLQGLDRSPDFEPPKKYQQILAYQKHTYQISSYPKQYQDFSDTCGKWHTPKNTCWNWHTIKIVDKTSTPQKIAKFKILNTPPTPHPNSPSSCNKQKSEYSHWEPHSSDFNAADPIVVVQIPYQTKCIMTSFLCVCPLASLLVCWGCYKGSVCV